MFRNYLKVALRYMIRQKYFSIINLLGLSLGISCCVFIALWVTDELQTDRFHANGKRLYWVLANQQYTDSDIQTTWATPGLLADALKAEIPGVELSANMSWEDEPLVTVQKESHKEKGRYV